MKLLPFVLLLFAVTTITSGCGKIADSYIDSEVEKALEESNKNLPADMGNGISLVKVDYDKDVNKITMKYTVSDRQLFDRHLGRVKVKAKNRVRKNAGLKRAMENGIRVFHQFRAGTADDGEVLAEFETGK